MTQEQYLSTCVSTPFGELNLCWKEGIAYQRDRTVSVPYDQAYFDKYVSYEGTKIAQKLNAFRTDITRKYCSTLLDIGIGSGEFIKSSKVLTYGYDINESGVQWLKERNLYLDPYTDDTDLVQGFTFWDSLEHIPEPIAIIERVPAYAFVSLPVFADLKQIRRSKHYRPNEHYFYYTFDGLVRLFDYGGFELVEFSDGEILAGREDIYTFVFRRRSCEWTS